MGFMSKLKRYGQAVKNETGQTTLQGMLAVIILVFIVFIVGDSILSGTALDPDTNNLTNIGLVTLSAVVIIAGMAGIVLRLL